MTAVQDVLGRDTVTVVHRTAIVDERGNDSFTETRTDWPRCNMQPVDSVETVNGNDQVVTRWRLSGPAAMGLAALDRIEWQGDTFTVDGEPGVHRSFAALLDHTEATLKKVTG
ncbi:hypothetical protein [Streptomyces sp. DW26H14]|uniref:hypothetical protein n=1 Tax=Streptomyces sp. DW26H14 TaxID=3435395 RepID=UPI00403DBC94